MATKKEKMLALTNLFNDGIFTEDEYSKMIAILNKEKNEKEEKMETPLSKEYNDVFKKYIIGVFKSPDSCKWPELLPDMIMEGPIKIDSKEVECTYIETYIDATNSYGAYLRKKIRLVVNEEGKIIRILQEAQTSGVTLLGMLGNALLKGCWIDLVKIK